MPGPTFELAGNGELSILGQQLTRVSAAISQSGATVAAELHTGLWRVGSIPIDCRLDLTLRGEVDLRKRTRPSFALGGAGSLHAFGAKVDGRAALTARLGNLAVEVEGQLTWQGREWLGGRVRMGSQGITLSGRTSFALDLTPSQLGPGVNVANLFFRIELGGSFTLNAGAGLARYSIIGDALLGARLAESDDPSRDQIFPLATCSFAKKGEAELHLPLIHVDGFRLVPAFDLGDLSIPVPVVLPGDTESPLRFKTQRVHADHNHRVRLLWEDNPLLPIEIPGIATLPDIRVDDGFDYQIPLDWDIGTIKVDLPLTTAFDLALVWFEGELAVRITRPLQQGQPKVQHWKLSTAFPT